MNDDDLLDDNPFKLDWELIGRMCEAGAKGAEIEARLGLPQGAIYRQCKHDLGITFNEFKRSKRAVGDLSLRCMQHKLALQGNVPVLLFLAKSRLKQSEKPPIKIEGFSEMNFKDKTKAIMKLIDEEKVNPTDLSQLMQSLKIAFELENGIESIDKLEELEKKHAI